MSYLLILFLVVLTMLVNSLTSSVMSGWMESNSASDIYPVSFRSSNQYDVSLASFSAMFILLRKSASDCPYTPSATNAPIAVPLLRHCFDRTNSLRSVVSSLYSFTIRMAKAYDFSCMTLFFIITQSAQTQRQNLPYISPTIKKIINY